MTALAHRSTWLTAALYHNGPLPRCGFLCLFLADGTALLYGNIPSWVPGLIAAHRSPGRAYNLLVKAPRRYPYQKLDRKQAGELRRMVK